MSYIYSMEPKQAAYIDQQHIKHFLTLLLLLDLTDSEYIEFKWNDHLHYFHIETAP